MKRSLYLFVSVLIILIIGGCGFMEKDVADMDPKDLPDVTAFQDDFTREFMASKEPWKKVIMNLNRKLVDIR